jgi:hypothetical protein
MVGQQLTIPVTSATGTVSNSTQLITNIADATHVTVANAVATAAGSKVAGGASLSLACNTTNPTPYAEWPDPTSAPVVQRLGSGGAARGTLGFTGSDTTETLTDDGSVADTTLMNAASSPSRLLYVTNPLTQDTRISGVPSVTIKAAFSKSAANLSAALVSLPATGNGTILTRGWKDPANSVDDYTTTPLVPGQFVTVKFDMQAKDAIVPAGRRLGLMVFSTDRQYTIRPAAGTQMTLDLAGSSFSIPIVGGSKAFAAATGNDLQDTTAGGTVPATLALTMGAPAQFGAFTPGVAKEYSASTTASVISTAGDATLSVADPSSNATGHLVNGAFSLPQPLQGLGVVRTYNAPVSNDVATVTFKQAIGTTDALRTGTYSKTLTFTLSTTTP